MNEQIIEVEFNKDLVAEYKDNYIMEEEGIGAVTDAEPYDPQTNINEVPFDDMLEEEITIEEADKND